MALHHHAREQPLQVEGHHLLQGHGGEHWRRTAFTQVGGNLHETGQVLLGHLDPGELVMARIGIADQGSDVEAEVADEGKGMGRIHRQGRQDRKDRLVEIGIDPIFLIGVQPFVIEQLHAMVKQLVLEIKAVMGLLLVQQGLEGRLDAVELLLGR